MGVPVPWTSESFSYYEVDNRYRGSPQPDLVRLETYPVLGPWHETSSPPSQLIFCFENCYRLRRQNFSSVRSLRFRYLAREVGAE